MLLQSVVMAASLLATTPATAFQDEGTAQAQGAPRADEGAAPATTQPAEGRRQAVPRAVTRPSPVPARTTEGPANAGESKAVAAQDDQRRSGSRDRGDNPQTGGAAQRGDRPRGENPATGRAVPRESGPAPAPARPPQVNRRAGNGGGRVVVAPRVYNYYDNPRRYYPYGYGAFGLGYFYYDPYTWYPPASYGGYYGGGYYGGFDGYLDLGEVRLAVSPRSGEVYVDGYYAGRVDEFDGVFQALKLEPGIHHIQILASGYLPLDFDVRLNPGQKITYRGELRR